MRHRLAMLAAALTALALPATSPAQPVTCDRVAARDGSDTAAGTLAAPLKTAQKLADSLAPGQTGCLRAGTYAESTSGYVLRANRPDTTLRSYPGERAKLFGIVHVPATTPGVTLSHLDFEGDGTMNAIKVYAADLTLTDSDVTNGGRAYSCIMLGSSSAGTAARAAIRRNVLHDCGLNTTNRDHAIYAAAATDGEIVDNLIVNPAAYAVQLYPNAQRMRVAHNVVDGGSTVRGGVVFGGEGSSASSDNVVEQNVIAYPATRAVATYWPALVGSGNVTRDNCIHGGDLASQVGFTDSGTIASDPLFVDRAARDYRLRAGSACLAKVGYDTAAKLRGEAAPAPEPQPAPTTEPAPAPTTEPAPAPTTEPVPALTAAPAPATEPAPSTDPAPQPVTAANLAPTVVLTSPGAASYLTRTVSFSVQAADDESVAKVEYYVDGKLVAASSSAPFSVAWKLPRKLGSGRHTVVAKAYDGQGLSAASDPVVVYR